MRSSDARAMQKRWILCTTKN